jgi:alpha-N-arabinofuranosidase
VKGAAVGFPESEWFSTMENTLRMDKFVRDNAAVLDKNDPEKKIGFDVDEWGTWYDVEKGTNPGFLFQRNTIRDAVVAGLNLNIFHAHADRVRMSMVAQMVNVLQAMVITDKDRMLLTPTYWTFHMYKPFQGATSLPVTLSNNTTYAVNGKGVPGISASSAVGKDGKTYVALVNANVVLSVAGRNPGAARGRILTAAAMDAHNTFEHKDAVKPAPYSANAAGGKLTLQVPAKSVIVVALED